ncbi:MAG: FliO/MopB family protein [Nitrospinales bacterium]
MLNHKINIVVICLSILIGFDVVGAEDVSRLNTLQDVLVENKDDALLVRLAFLKPLSNQKPPVFHKKTAQIDFANAKYKASSHYFPVENSKIDQIYLSQFEKDTLRMRFMLAKGDDSFSKKFKWEVKGRFLNIRIFKEQNASLKSLSVIENPKTNFENIQKLDEITSSKPEEKIKADGDALLKGLKNPLSKKDGKNISPNILFKSNEPINPKKSVPGNQKTSKPEESVKRNIKPVFADTLSLRSTSLKMVYMMLVVLGILFSVFYLFKKFVWKNSVFSGPDKPVNVLSTGYLGPKKSIALVEVAGEVLVLGIANDNISLLSNIKDANKVERIKHPEKPTKLSSIVVKKKNPNISENKFSEEKEEPKFDYAGNSAQVENDSKYTRSDVATMIRKNLEKMGATT